MYMFSYLDKFNISYRSYYSSYWKDHNSNFTLPCYFRSSLWEGVIYNYPLNITSIIPIKFSLQQIKYKYWETPLLNIKSLVKTIHYIINISKKIILTILIIYKLLYF